MASALVDALLETQALRLAPPGELFWYTSGTVGPYYINTHYLYGGPQPAEELLRFIDQAKEDRPRFPILLRDRVQRNYGSNGIYRAVVDQLVAQVQEQVGDGFDCISGGERRDWFFSAAVAAQLDCPHLLIYKDLSHALCRDDRVHAGASLDGLRVVHIADLVTEASSYLRAWIPAVRQGGGHLVHSVNVVDRGQGGIEAIGGAGVPAGALVRVDEGLFAALRQAGRIDARQEDLLVAYFRDPHAAMKAFLEQHPEFLRRSLASQDGRTAARARLLVEQNPYGLAGEYLASYSA